MRHTNYPLIGLCGYKGTGKDTVAGHMVKMYNFERRAFATKLKEAVANLFAITPEQVDVLKQNNDVTVAIMTEVEGALHAGNIISWRGFLQRFGTEMGRNTFGSDFWVNLAMSTPLTKPTVFTDARFPNEQSHIKALGGKIVWVERRGYTSDGHASEQKPGIHMIDYVLYNDSDFVSLFDEVDEMLIALYNMEPVT